MSNTGAPRSRTQLVVIVLIAVASLSGSYGFFYWVRGGSVWGTTNYGEFVTPPVQVADLRVTDVAGARFVRGDTWWLWVVVDAGCSAPCERALHQLRQLHVLLNRDAPRVRRALVSVGHQDLQASQDVYPGLAHLVVAGPLRNGVFIVDPIGNLVLWYPFADAGKPVLEDLRRLLKLSQIG
jgi:hypothetical protein